mmetsp:Transcript_5933/g.8452  ORF Transcript_5933/g.8452 Transcript_5933/m.8452 type:complete len:80 (+) Transcript_5933:55-294(+)
MLKLQLRVQMEEASGEEFIFDASCKATAVPRRSSRTNTAVRGKFKAQSGLGDGNSHLRWKSDVSNAVSSQGQGQDHIAT